MNEYNLSRAKYNAFLDEKYSFIFVREPYQRLFSTYCNKFYLPKEHWAPIGPYIAKRYRDNPSPDSLKFGYDVTFKELIQYIVDNFEQGAVLDKHLKPMHELCDLCGHNYSFIGRLESINDDWERIISEWKQAALVKQSITTTSGQFSRNLLKECGHLFKTLNLTSTSSIPRSILFRRTWSYYKITGRISMNIPFPFKDDEVDNINKTQYKAAIRKAMEQSKDFGQEVAKQRKEALLQAYSTIPPQLLERLRKVVLVDCLMFGYDDRPNWLFNRNSSQKMTSYNYFPEI